LPWPQDPPFASILTSGADTLFPGFTSERYLTDEVRSARREPAKGGVHVLISRDDSAGNDAVRTNTLPEKASMKEDANDPVSGAAGSRAAETVEDISEVNSGVRSAISSPAVGTKTKQHDPQEQGSAQTSSTGSKEVSQSGFHVFTWLSSYGTAGPDQETQFSDKARILGIHSANRYLQEALEEMNRFLGHETNQDERRTYRACPVRKVQEIFDVLADGTKVAVGLEKSRVTHQTKIDLFDAAQSVFEVFLPLHFDGPTVGKYWGALYRHLAVSADNNIT
jgi:hypothetical protein